MLEEELVKFYSNDGPERGGFVLGDGFVVERPNASPDPQGSFCLSAEDLIKHEAFAVATWHTHPGASANLSGDDYIAFRNWSNLKHYIIGNNGVRCYAVDDGGRVLEQTD